MVRISKQSNTVHFFVLKSFFKNKRKSCKKTLCFILFALFFFLELEKTLWKALKACGNNPTLIKAFGDFAENLENIAESHKMFKKILLKDIKNSSLQVSLKEKFFFFIFLKIFQKICTILL